MTITQLETLYFNEQDGSSCNSKLLTLSPCSPGALRPQLRVNTTLGYAGEQQWLEGAHAVAPSTVSERSTGCGGSRAAFSGHCHFFPGNFMPLVRSPHLHDKPSYFVHTHLKEGANHPSTQTWLSRAQHMWVGQEMGVAMETHHFLVSV